DALPISAVTSRVEDQRRSSPALGDGIEQVEAALPQGQRLEVADVAHRLAGRDLGLVALVERLGVTPRQRPALDLALGLDEAGAQLRAPAARPAGDGARGPLRVRPR